MIWYILTFLKELGMTFSNKGSLFSSKRIERFVIFSAMLGATIVWLRNNIGCGKVSSTELMIVVAGWMAYAGFNVIQGKKDKTGE